MEKITEVEKQDKSEKKIEDTDYYLKKIYEEELRIIVKRCISCGRCSGVCQLSKVQKYTPSRIIEMILEGFEDKVIESGVLWDCLTCNTCMTYCPEDISFADLVRVAKYKMRKLRIQNVDDYIAHKGMYTTISEIMSQSSITPKRNLDWIPTECKTSHKGNTHRPEIPRHAGKDRKILKRTILSATLFDKFMQPGKFLIQDISWRSFGKWN